MGNKLSVAICAGVSALVWIAVTANPEPKAAIAATATTAPIDPDTQLQLQFREWSYHRGGYVEMLVSMRNPTHKPFRTVAWDCDFLDREGRLVGQSPIVVNVVPFRVVVGFNQIVAGNGMFQDGECRLAGVEDLTFRNERLGSNRPAFKQIAHPIGGSAERWWSPDHRIQGSGQVVTPAENARLAQQHKEDGLASGYKLPR